MTYHHGWLQIAEENDGYKELFNHARTAAYLEGSNALGCGTVYGVLDDGGCAGYNWLPCESTELEGIGLEPEDLVVSDWAGYWDAKAVSANGSPINLGTAGADLNATNEGLIHVKGPGFWTQDASAGTNRLTATNPGTGTPTTLDMRVAIINHRSDWDVACRIWRVTTGDAELSMLSSGNGALAARLPGGNITLDSPTDAGVPVRVPVIFRVTWDDAITTAKGFWKTTTRETVDADIVDNFGWIDLGTDAAAGDGSAGYALGETMALASTSGLGWTDEGVTILAATQSEVIGGAPDVALYNSDLVGVAAAATAVSGSTGESWTVERATDGPATVLIPSGHSVLINPDESVGANRMTVNDDVMFDIPAGDDAMIVWTGQPGNHPTGFPVLLGQSSTPFLRITYADNPAFTLIAHDGTAQDQPAAFTGSNEEDVICVIGRIRDSDTTIEVRAYDSTGLLDETSIAFTRGAIIPTDTFYGMSGIAGTFYSMAYNAGTGIAKTDAEVDALAAAFLAAATTQNPVDYCLETYTTPKADNAPWYNPAYPESAQALGFWVTEWTGLDSGHVTRQMTDVGAYRGGAEFGATGAGGRTMGFEVILLGESEKALEYLYQWLDSTLSSVCVTCATDTVLIRRFCPTGGIDETDDGVAELREVGLIQGLQWGAPPVEQAGCFIRRVNFTMAAADPCMYSACTGKNLTQEGLFNDCFDPANINPTRSQCRPTCSEMEGVCREVFNYTIDTAAPSAPRIILTAPPPATIGIVGVDDVESTSMPVRIRTYRNDLDLSPDELCGAPLLAELYVTGLPAYSELLYDIPGRTVQYRDPGTGDWINGYAFLEPNDVGTPRFAALGCGQFTTIIEPSNFCLTAKTQDVTVNSDVNAMTQGPDAYYFAGTFGTAFGRTVNKLTSLSLEGARAGNFNLGGTVGMTQNAWSITMDASGRLLVGGAFVSARGVVQNGFCRLFRNGVLDTTFNTGGTVGIAGGTVTVYAIAVQGDGKIIIGGDFDDARGTVGVNNLARLNADGTLDTTFNTGGTLGVNGRIWAITIQDDGKILVGGAFLAARGTTVNRIVRLETDGTVDTTFNTGGTIGVNGTVHAIVIQPDGRAIIGGTFLAARGTTVNRIIRLDNDGTVDASWDVSATAGADSTVRTIALQPDGKVFIGGGFTNARGTTVNRIARLNADGTLDTGFNIGGTIGNDSNVYASELQPDGKIVIGGAFDVVRGTAAERLARLHTDGTFDSDFQRATAYENMTVPPTMTLSVQERMGCA